MNAYSIILGPVITGKSTNLMDNEKHTSNMLLIAIKTQVRNAVEKVSDARVKSVDIMNVRGKDKRIGRYAGKTARRRKTIVTLTNDSNDIKIFTEEDNK